MDRSGPGGANSGPAQPRPLAFGPMLVKDSFLLVQDVARAVARGQHLYSQVWSEVGEILRLSLAVEPSHRDEADVREPDVAAG
jgi:hypothetical protein